MRGRSSHSPFPHIGNVGANHEDLEADNPQRSGCIVRQDVTAPSNFRANQSFDFWMKSNGRIGLAGVDTRALTRRIREGGAPNAVIAHRADGMFDLDALREQARAWPGLEGMDLAQEVSCRQLHRWTGRGWRLGSGYGADEEWDAGVAGEPHIVAIDYGSKRNIFRSLRDAGSRVTVLPATASFDEVMAHKPDGFFLSNGPGDPAATGRYAVPVIQQLLETKKPLFGICLGHQLLALAIGGRTGEDAPGPPRRQPPGQAPRRRPRRDHQHEPRLRGRAREPARQCARNPHQPVRRQQLRLELTDRPAFSVQYHPEASPGPQDSQYLFAKFVESI
jgi:carbamoyl-phosphate synthase small subunit